MAARAWENGDYSPVCMLTKTLLALNATLSHRPETKLQAMTGISECAGSTSSASVDRKPGLGRWAGGGAAPDDSDEAFALRAPGVLIGVALRGGVSPPIVGRLGLLDRGWRPSRRVDCPGVEGRSARVVTDVVGEKTGKTRLLTQWRLGCRPALRVRSTS